MGSDKNGVNHSTKIRRLYTEQYKYNVKELVKGVKWIICNSYLLVHVSVSEF